MMAPVELPYLDVFESHGRFVAYYRRGGHRWRLLREDGAFVDPADWAELVRGWQRRHDAYEAAKRVASAAVAAREVRPRSIAHLIAEYRQSPDWDEKGPETKRDYEKALRPLERDWGHLSVAGMLKRHVTKVRDRYAWRVLTDKAGRPVLDGDGRPQRVRNARQANRVVTVLSILLSHAVDPLGWREDNPALRPKRLRQDGDGYRAWTQDEFRQFTQRQDEEWRFAALLALLTGQRGQDQVRMRWTDYEPDGGGRVHVVQEKGRKLVKLWVPCHPLLRAALEQRRAALAGRAVAPMTLLARPDGKEWKVQRIPEGCRPGDPRRRPLGRGLARAARDDGDLGDRGRRLRQGADGADGLADGADGATLQPRRRPAAPRRTRRRRRRGSDRGAGERPGHARCQRRGPGSANG
jgi:integrase